jgi:hypothetical protein
MITDNRPARSPDERWVLYRIISRHSWERLQSRKECHPGSSVEHFYRGLYMLKVPSEGLCPCEVKKRRAICPRSSRAVWEKVA